MLFSLLNLSRNSQPLSHTILLYSSHARSAPKARGAPEGRSLIATFFHLKSRWTKGIEETRRRDNSLETPQDLFWNVSLSTWSMPSVPPPPPSPCDEDDEEVAPPECSICMDKITQNKKRVTTPCKHVFHKQCLDKWTERFHTAPTCPNCRAVIGKAPRYTYQESQRFQQERERFQQERERFQQERERFQQERQGFQQERERFQQERQRLHLITEWIVGAPLVSALANGGALFNCYIFYLKSGWTKGIEETVESLHVFFISQQASMPYCQCQAIVRRTGKPCLRETKKDGLWYCGYHRGAPSAPPLLECSICMNEITKNEEMVTTPCKHVFHKRCFTIAWHCWFLGSIIRDNRLRRQQEEQGQWALRNAVRMTWDKLYLWIQPSREMGHEECRFLRNFFGRVKFVRIFF